MRTLLPAAALLGLSWSGCIQGGKTGPVDEETARRLLPLELRSGETTREEALLKLGIPSARFENDRILCYRVLETADGAVFPGRASAPKEPWDHDRGFPTHNLVLVFDERGRLARHSMLCIRQTVGRP